MTFSNINSAARAAALKLYALLSPWAQGGGHVAIGLGQLDFGKVPTLLAGAGVIFALGVARARLLQGPENCRTAIRCGHRAKVGLRRRGCGLQFLKFIPSESPDDEFPPR